MRATKISASWVKLVKSNELRRRKKDEEERAKVNVNNGQVNAWTNKLFAGRVVANKKLFAGTIPATSHNEIH